MNKNQNGKEMYVFEQGFYPLEQLVDRKPLGSDEDAIAHAKKIGADYVWGVQEGANPRTVWDRRRDPKL